MSLVKYVIIIILLCSLTFANNLGSIKEVQRGSAMMTSTTLNITIPNAVDLTKSFLYFTTNFTSASPTEFSLRGNITNSTLIRFSKTTATNIMIEWQIIEFERGVNVNRGDVSSTTAIIDVTIPSVNVTQSFSLVNYLTTGTAYGTDDSPTNIITSATNLRLNAYAGTASRLHTWQTIDYNNTKVQSGNLLMTGLNSNFTINTVNLSKSYIISSVTLSGTGTPANAGIFVNFTNSTNIQFIRYNNSINLNITFYVIEFTGNERVYYGNNNFSVGVNSVNVPITTINLSRSAVFLSGGIWGGSSNHTTDDNMGHASYMANLTNNNLRLTRGLTTSEGNIGWFIVEYDKRFPKITNLILNSTSNTNTISENLTCNYDLSSSATSSVISWYKNNVSQMIVYLPMEVNNTNSLMDYSGINNDFQFPVSVTARPTFNNSVVAVGNGSLFFDGGDYIYKNITSTTLNFTQNFTIVGWLYKNNTKDYARVFGRYYYTTVDTGSYFMYFDTLDRLSVGIKIGGTFTTLLSTPSLNNKTWYQVGLGYNSTTMYIIINGTIVTSQALTGIVNNTNNYPITLGGSFDGTTFQTGFIGGLDDFRIYNSSLSSQQIKSLYDTRIGNVIVSNELISNDIWQCRVTPFSNIEIGQTYISNNLTIISNFIGLQNLILNSIFNTNRSDENLTCNYNLISLATTSSIAWYKNNQPLMQLYLPMEGNSTNALLDYSGNGNNGTLFPGRPFPNWLSNGGYDGYGAFNFSGTGTINIPYRDYFNLSNKNFTISFWIKYNVVTGTQSVIDFLSAGTGHNSLLHSPTLGWYWESRPIGGATTNIINQTTSTSSVGIWQYMTVVRNSDNWTIYKNGSVLVSRINSIVLPQSTNMSIGWMADNSNNLNATLDDFRIYNYSLSSQQILALYNNRTNLIVSQELTNNDIWQCRVTPFSSIGVGTTSLSNNLTIDNCIPPLNSNWDLTLHCNIINRIYNRAYRLNVSNTGWLNISGNSIINFSKIIWYPTNSTEPFRIRWYIGSKVRVPE